MLDIIRTIADPILRERSKPLDAFDPREAQFCTEKLRNAFNRIFSEHPFSSSAGLSLVQIGILKRGCIVWFPGSEPFIMFNPEIENRSIETDYKYEGCLSFFEQRGLVARHSAIDVSYLDHELRPMRRHFSGWPARIIQHEIDHMDGILYSDRMEKNHMLIGLDDYAAIKPYARIQNSAKDTVFDLLDFIRPGVTEKDIALKAKALLEQKGITQFWYYGVAALVLVGDRTTLSISGRDYIPADTSVQENDLVTIDLSPMDGELWGDYARSIYVEDSVAKLAPTQNTLAAGFNLESLLHGHLLDIAKPDMTAHELWVHMNAMIEECGFENLDFKGNLGHSIEKDMKQRRYIEKDNITPLRDFGLFTFEPHVRQKGQMRGFKHENIHFFAGAKLQPL